MLIIGIAVAILVGAIVPLTAHFCRAKPGDPSRTSSEYAEDRAKVKTWRCWKADGSPDNDNMYAWSYEKGEVKYHPKIDWFGKKK